MKKREEEGREESVKEKERREGFLALSFLLLLFLNGHKLMALFQLQFTAVRNSIPLNNNHYLE